MKTFFEWMAQKNEAKGHKDLTHPLHSLLAKHNIVSLTPKKRKKKKFKRAKVALKKVEPAPMVHVDMDKWLQAVSALAKDLEEYKKVKKQADDKMAKLEKKKQEQEKIAKKTEKFKKPDSNKSIQKNVEAQQKSKQGKNVVSKENIGKRKKPV